MIRPQDLAALAQLLGRLFETGELRRVIATMSDGDEIGGQLPGSNASAAEVSFALTRVLEARGMLDDAFFDRLLTERPRKAAEIEAMRVRFAVPREVKAPADPPAMTAIDSFLGGGREAVRAAHVIENPDIDLFLAERTGSLRLGLAAFTPVSTFRRRRVYRPGDEVQGFLRPGREVYSAVFHRCDTSDTLIKVFPPSSGVDAAEPLFPNRTYLVIDGHATNPLGEKRFFAVSAELRGPLTAALELPVNVPLDVAAAATLRSSLVMQAAQFLLTQCSYCVER